MLIGPLYQDWTLRIVAMVARIVIEVSGVKGASRAGVHAETYAAKFEISEALSRFAPEGEDSRDVPCQCSQSRSFG